MLMNCDTMFELDDSPDRISLAPAGVLDSCLQSEQSQLISISSSNGFVAMAMLVRLA